MGSRQVVGLLDGHTDRINAVQADMSRGLAVTASNDETVRMWDLGKHCCFGTYLGHQQPVRDVVADFVSEEQVIVSCSDDATLRVWDVASGRCSGTLKGHLDRVNVVKAKWDRKKIISGSSDYSIKIWDLETLNCEETLFGHCGSVLSLVMG